MALSCGCAQVIGNLKICCRIIELPFDRGDKYKCPILASIRAHGRQLNYGKSNHKTDQPFQYFQPNQLGNRQVQIT